MMIDLWRLLPSHWFQNEPTDWVWDKILSAALDRHAPILISNRFSDTKGCSCQVGPFTIWIGNWPYAYGDLWENGQKGRPPSVGTRRRLRAALQGVNVTEQDTHYVELAKRLIERESR